MNLNVFRRRKNRNGEGDGSTPATSGAKLRVFRRHPEVGEIVGVAENVDPNVTSPHVGEVQNHNAESLDALLGRNRRRR